MAFGNPYGESWKWEDVDFWAKRFEEIGIKHILLSDTTGVGDVERISLFLIKFPQNIPILILGRIFIIDTKILISN
jgi:hydroxymethylglutaryl-CoA lyase